MRISSALAAVLAGVLVLTAPILVPGAAPLAAAEALPDEVPAPPSDTPVRVGLAWGQTTATVSGTAGLWIVADGALQGEVPPGVPVGLRAQDGGVFVDAVQAWFGGRVRLVPQPPGHISFQGRSYRGEIEAVPTAGDKLSVVNVVNLEEYLLAVVPAEMPHTWPMEALKAQAVAARSFTLANLGKRRDQGFDLRNNTDDQVYRGIGDERPSTTAAVLETAGQVVTYQGRVISTNFHSSSGGHTENNEDYWTGGSPTAYLRGVVDYDNVPGNPYIAWEREFTVEDFSQRLNDKGYAVGTVIQVTPGATGASDRPTTWIVTGTGGTRTLTMRQMREALGLPAAPRAITLSGPGSPVTEPDPAPVPEPEPEPAPPEPQVAVLGADGNAVLRSVSGSYVLSAGGVMTVLAGPAAVASRDGYALVGVVTRPDRSGSTPVSRGEGADRGDRPEPAPMAVTVTGSGNGHGVGMSQWGAHGMALQGKNYVEILTHYFTGTKVETR